MWCTISQFRNINRDCTWRLVFSQPETPAFDPKRPLNPFKTPK